MSDKSKATQFGNGRNTPNRKGRPKGSPNIKTVVREFAQQMHKVTIEGKEVELNTVQLVISRLRIEVVMGNPRAAKIRDKHLGQYLASQSQTLQPVIVLGKRLSVEDWTKMVEKKNQYYDRIMKEEQLKARHKKPS